MPTTAAVGGPAPMIASTVATVVNLEPYWHSKPLRLPDKQKLARISLWFEKDSLYKSPVLGVYPVQLVTNDQQRGWCEALYQAKAADLLLYGRALGLSHGEAEDVLQDTFVALVQRSAAPSQPEHYCVRAFRNRAL